MKAAVVVGLLGLLLFVFYGVDYLIVNLIGLAEPIITDLSKMQEKQVDIYVETNKQLMTLATLMFAGVGWYFDLYFRDGAKARRRGLFFVSGSMLMAAFSIYMGYLSYDKMVWMLSKRFFNLDTSLLYWFRTLQLWSFLASILLLGWVWLGELWSVTRRSGL